MRGGKKNRSWLRRGTALGLGLTAIWITALTVEFPTPQAALKGLGKNPEFAVTVLSGQLGWKNHTETMERIGSWGRLLLDQSALLSGSTLSLDWESQEPELGHNEGELSLEPDEEEMQTERVPPVIGGNVVQHTSLGDYSSNYQWIGNVCLQNTTGYTVTLSEIPQVQLEASCNEGPQILIYHTHGSEAYTQTEETRYVETDSYRTTDCERNVVKVGEEMAQVFRTQGFQVIHDTTLYDYPVYNGAYERSRKGLEQWLEQYPSIYLILDVHRDALVTQEGAAYQFTAQEGDKTVAQVMLVVGSGEGGAEHPDWQKNLSLALDFQDTLGKRYEQLVRPVVLRSSRFNQHLSSGALLVEVGGHGNTLPQAIEAARMFARTTGARLKTIAKSDS